MDLGFNISDTLQFTIKKKLLMIIERTGSSNSGGSLPARQILAAAFCWRVSLGPETL